MQFTVTLSATVHAASISDVDDDRMCEALMECQGVEAVTGRLSEAGEVPTDQQALKLASLLRDHDAIGADVKLRPFDLPEGYIYVVLLRTGVTDFHVGISPEGEGSS